jgi:hypothetical protein
MRHNITALHSRLIVCCCFIRCWSPSLLVDPSSLRRSRFGSQIMMPQVCLFVFVFLCLGAGFQSETLQEFINQILNTDTSKIVHPWHKQTHFKGFTSPSLPAFCDEQQTQVPPPNHKINDHRVHCWVRESHAMQRLGKQHRASTMLLHNRKQHPCRSSLRS